MSIHHVALELRAVEADAARAFWAALRFVAVEPPAALRDRAIWLQRGTSQIHLLLTDAPVAPPQGHVAVVAADYEDALARLRALGHEARDRPRHWGAARAFVTAPGGHRVEVMARPPLAHAPGG